MIDEEEGEGSRVQALVREMVRVVDCGQKGGEATCGRGGGGEGVDVDVSRGISCVINMSTEEFGLS